MVYFVCVGCNETLKKNQVDTHARRCRGCWGVSCVDCGVTFEGDSFQGHLTCVSEAEKYEKTVYRGGKNQKKRSPQDEWQFVLDTANERSAGAPANVQPILPRLAEAGNVPRQYKKFLNWVGNSMRLRDARLIEAVWRFVDDVRLELKPATPAGGGASTGGGDDEEEEGGKAEASTKTSEDDGAEEKKSDKKQKKEKKSKKSTKDDEEEGHAHEDDAPSPSSSSSSASPDHASLVQSANLVDIIKTILDGASDDEDKSVETVAKSVYKSLKKKSEEGSEDESVQSSRQQLAALGKSVCRNVVSSSLRALEIKGLSVSEEGVVSVSKDTKDKSSKKRQEES